MHSRFDPLELLRRARTPLSCLSTPRCIFAEAWYAFRTAELQPFVVREQDRLRDARAGMVTSRVQIGSVTNELLDRGTVLIFVWMEEPSRETADRGFQLPIVRWDVRVFIENFWIGIRAELACACHLYGRHLCRERECAQQYANHAAHIIYC